MASSIAGFTALSHRPICLAVACIIIFATYVLGEKGDTVTTVMTKDIPQGLLDAGFVAPTGKAAKDAVNMVITDAGVKKTKFEEFTGYSWTADFPSETFQFSRIALASSKLPGTPIFFNITTDNTPEFFKSGNWTIENEIGDALVAAGLDTSALLDNSTYAITVLDEATKTALAGTLLSRTVAVYGNGSYGNQTGTESDLVSELVYVATVDNTTVAFEQGFTNGYIPGNGTGVALLQQLPGGDFLWTLDIEFIERPESLQLRYFVDLGYQPIVADLKPSIAFPRTLESDLASFDGNLTQAEITAGLESLGLDWSTTNFNNTPSLFMLTFNERSNATVTGFVYDATQAPQPQPVIKGSAVCCSAILLSLCVSIVAAAFI